MSLEPALTSRVARDPIGRIAACALLGAIGYSSFAALPLLLGFFGKYRGFAESSLGWVGSSEMLGLLLGSLIAARLLNKVRTKPLLLIGLSIALLANLATLISVGLPLLLVCRLLSGFGGGICYALATTLLATSNKPERNFGLFMIASVVEGAALFLGMPWLDSHFGMPGPIGLMAAWLIVGYPLILIVPSPPAPADMEEARAITDGGNLHAGRVVLSATVAFGTVLTASWSLIERIADASTISLATVGFVLNLSNLACILPSVAAAWLSERFSPRIITALTLLLCAGAMVTWQVGHDTILSYAVRCLVLFMGLTFVQIQLFAILASTDPSGRQAALAPAALGVGQVLGPIVGASTFSFGGFHGSLLADAALAVVTALGYHFASGRLPKQSIGASPRDTNASKMKIC